MRLTLAFITLFLSASYYARSQDSTFELKDYKYRTKGFRALNLTGSLGGSYINKKNNYLSDPDNSMSNLYFGPLSANYFQTYNQDKHIHSLDSWFSTGFSADKNKVDHAESKRNYFLASGGIEVSDAYYKGSRFLETGYSVSNELEIQKLKDSNSTNKILIDRPRAEFTIGIGKGRVENVTDAQMAMFILNDLEDQGLLSRHPDGQTYYELATLITQINNKRVFDSRRRRIFELSQIDSFIREKNLAVTDIRHFTTINDNWSLANNPGRLSGKKIYFRLRPGTNMGFSKVKLENSPNDYTNISSSVPFTVFPEIGFESYRPVNLHWQHDYGIGLTAGRKWSVTENELNTPNQPSNHSKFKYKSSNATFNAFYDLSYFPNNRTTLSLGAFLTSQYEIIDETKNKYLAIGTGLSFNTSYFVNYRTRLNLSASLSEVKNREGNDLDSKISEFNSRLSLSISHSIL